MPPRDATQEFHHQEENREEINEPKRAEWLHEGFEIKTHGAKNALLHREARKLEQELDRHPQRVEIHEMQDAAVEIAAPVTVDHARHQQARDQEERGDPERLGEVDRFMQPAVATKRCLDPERRMHHHHEDDGQSARIVDPGNPFVSFGNHGHLWRRMNRFPILGFMLSGAITYIGQTAM
jgi:hypothetical protein